MSTSNPKRPDSIPDNAWRVMQWMRSGNDLCIPSSGKPNVQGCGDVSAAALDFLLSNGLLVETARYDFGTFYRMSDEAWAIAAGDVEYSR